MSRITMISDKGIDCIRISEGLKLKAYRDSGGLITIGIGTTRYPHGGAVDMGDVCTESQAYDYFRHDAIGACKAIDDLTRDDLTQHQFDALVSLVYNIGRGNYAGSTLRQLINLDPKNPAIRTEFMRWNKVHGKEVAGLTSRRKREADLYFS